MNLTNELYAITPRPSRSSWLVRVVARHSPLFRGISLGLALLAPVVSGAERARAATPSPHPTAAAKARPPARIDVTKIQPKSLLPKRPEHQEYLVEINKYGQVARVRSQHGNGDRVFIAQTYGNALQTYIRTPDGHVVLGTYRLTYDFNPKTSRVRRDVVLVSQGGVDADAVGAVNGLLDKVHRAAPAALDPRSIDPRSLPDLGGLTPPTPTPQPTAH